MECNLHVTQLRVRERCVSAMGTGDLVARAMAPGISMQSVPGALGVPGYACSFAWNDADPLQAVFIMRNLDKLTRVGGPEIH